MLKELCDCGKISLWCYMPGYISGDNPYSCDDCVPRGCSCNHRFIDEEYFDEYFDDLPEGEENKDWVWIKEGVWTYIDEEGKQYPCSEYDYSDDGYERELNPHII